ncbi:hypothetical protein SAMN04488516_11523 [Desulfonauticus submarinus]|uniref:PD-(D/E)XK nuclease superfamily protein n=1 Tax=Desulfonauticus submarinus TaxID=206665 RepID=A0A1H0FYG9_9BACT|nr:hypothetical protein [Desulfonauticus submarinus]SDN99529.1 hypothetical protein SAMN04488516_11523 [Desulfonauticus submarinus]
MLDYFLEEQEDSIDSKEKMWGELYHLVFYFLSNFKSVKKDIEIAVKQAVAIYEMTDYLLYLEDKNISWLEDTLTFFVYNFLTLPLIKQFLKFDLHLNEVELIDRQGKIYRIDRILFSKEQVVVFDFKLKFDEIYKPKYESQVRKYISLLSGIGYNNIIGYLAYIKDGRIDKV